MKQTFLSAIICLFSLSSSFAQTKTTLNLVPVPVQMKVNAGQFVINSNTQIVLTPQNREMGNAIVVFNNLLNRAAGYRLSAGSAPVSSNVIICKINPAISNAEGYKLSVKPNIILLEAQTPRGIFYGMQTLRQLLPHQIERPYSSNAAWAIPCVEIEDYPRFVHRGLMLDACRHFQPKAFVMKFIDMLAYHKMNTFHWHLTEDQGWRIEIKKYPRLQQISAFRNRTLKGSYTSPEKRQWDNTRYGGFYTQEDIKEVIAYAQKRFITIIPEVEMPGHAIAALAAYPELSCTGGPFEVEGLWGVFDDIYCPKEETFTFLQNVLSEVMDLFPSEYIHIGGDEAPKKRWKHCAHCQELIKKEGLKNEHELQSYFIKRIEKFVESKGKHIIGWDEILEGGLAPNATVMSWRGEEGGIEAAKQNHDVIMTPNTYVYLDYYQANPKTEPLAIGGYLPLWKTYSFNPTPAALSPEEAKHILGIQGNIWTEYISTTEYVEYMAFPRGAAVAETGWSPDAKKNYTDFKARMIQQFKRYDGMNWNYCKAILTEEE
ncbi:MAG: beta-N-acetylhexosaminidase [Dysgonamonadaceae bacterium]|jgi:hexosaminidase|nr:beta-N-acetylhexosaminidase [Dysgonamonadaceae bacterium]